MPACLAAEDSNEDRAEFTEGGQAGDSRRCGALRFCWCLGDLLAIAIGHDPGRPADWMERLGRNEGATRRAHVPFLKFGRCVLKTDRIATRKEVRKQAKCCLDIVDGPRHDFALLFETGRRLSWDFGPRRIEKCSLICECHERSPGLGAGKCGQEIGEFRITQSLREFQSE